MQDSGDAQGTQQALREDEPNDTAATVERHFDEISNKEAETKNRGLEVEINLKKYWAYVALAFVFIYSVAALGILVYFGKYNSTVSLDVVLAVMMGSISVMSITIIGVVARGVYNSTANPYRSD